MCIRDSTLTIFTVVQSKEIIQILGSTDGRTAIAADDFENLQNKFRSQPVGI